MRSRMLLFLLSVACGPTVGDADTPRNCGGPVFWLSEEVDRFAMAHHFTSDRFWVRRRAGNGTLEQEETFTADTCGSDRRPLPTGYSIRPFRRFSNVVCDRVHNDLYRVDEALMPVGEPIASAVNCGFVVAGTFGLTFRIDSRELVRVTDESVEPLGISLPDQPHWTTSSGNGLVVRSDDALFAVASGGLYEIRHTTVSKVVNEGVAWASRGSKIGGEPPRWILIWEVRVPGATEDERVPPRLLDLASGAARELPTTETPDLEPPWLWTSTFLYHIERDEQYPLSDGWEVHAAVDAERVLLHRDDTDSTSVWDPSADSLLELKLSGHPWPGPDGVRITEDGYRWIYPYDGSPRIAVAPGQPPLSNSWLVDDDRLIGITEANELVVHEIASEQTTVLDEEVTDLLPNFMAPVSPLTITYEKQDGDRWGLWSVILDP